MTGNRKDNPATLSKFPGGESAYDLPVRIQELKPRQVFALDPADVAEDAILQLPFESLDFEELQLNGISVCVGMVNRGDLRPNLRLDAEFFVQLTAQRLLRCLARLDLAAGELPFQRQRLKLSSLTAKYLVTTQYDCGDHLLSNAIC